MYLYCYQGFLNGVCIVRFITLESLLFLIVDLNENLLNINVNYVSQSIIDQPIMLIKID